MTTDAMRIARASYQAYVDKDRGAVVEAELNIGWRLPHAAPAGQSLARE